MLSPGSGPEQLGSRAGLGELESRQDSVGGGGGGGLAINSRWAILKGSPHVGATSKSHHSPTPCNNYFRLCLLSSNL